MRMCAQLRVARASTFLCGWSPCLPLWRLLRSLKLLHPLRLLHLLLGCAVVGALVRFRRLSPWLLNLPLPLLLPPPG